MRSKNKALMEQILRYAEDFILSSGSAPTLRMIAAAVGVSKSTVHNYLCYMNDIGMIGYDGRQISTQRVKSYDTGVTPVPVFDNVVSCGPAGVQDQTLLEYISLPERIFGKGEYYIIRTVGDSMTDIGIEPGDQIVIEKTMTANRGDIIVALVNDTETTLKQFDGQDRDGSFILRYRNEAVYPNKSLRVKSMKVQGRLKYIIKEYAAEEPR